MSAEDIRLVRMTPTALHAVLAKTAHPWLYWNDCPVRRETALARLRQLPASTPCAWAGDLVYVGRAA